MNLKYLFFFYTETILNFVSNPVSPFFCEPNFPTLKKKKKCDLVSNLALVKRSE